MSSGTGTPSRWRSVGARSISRASSIAAARLKTGPQATRIPWSRCVPPHSEVPEGRCSQMTRGGLSVSPGKLGPVANWLFSLHQSRTRSAPSSAKGPWKISSRRYTRAITGSPVRGSLSSPNFSMMKSISAAYSAGSTIPAGFTPFRLIQMLGGDASTSLQYALVRVQSIDANDV